MTEETEKELNTTEVSVKNNNKKIAYITVISVIFAIAAAFAVQFLVFPALSNKEAQKVLDKIGAQQGDIVAVNNQIVTFKGQTIENANIEQKSLAINNSATTPAGFLFGNNKATPTKTVHVFLDLGNQTSRDFIIMNQNNLKGLVESGSIYLNIHIVPTGNAFNVYSAEALAEAFNTSPDDAWGFLVELAKTGTVLKTDSKEELLKNIAQTAKKSNIIDVDEKSIQNGTFASWLLTIGDDQRLQTGYYPPIIYVNNNLIDSKKVTLNDPDSLRKAILKN